jgi:hypothetical protein
MKLKKNEHIETLPDTVPKIGKIFSERKLRGLNPNFYIHVSVSDLYIPTSGLPVICREIK